MYLSESTLHELNDLSGTGLVAFIMIAILIGYTFYLLYKKF